MLLKGFTTPEAEDYVAKLSELSVEDAAELDKLVSSAKVLHKAGDVVYYSLPGLPLCWKCTIKHLGEALIFAREVEAYPERVICVVGALEHAYEECPDRKISNEIRSYYTKILDDGCVPDFTPLLKLAQTAWLSYLHDSK